MLEKVSKFKRSKFDILKDEPIEQVWSMIQTELEGQGMSLLAGVDEAGRGAVAGPVVAAAVVLSKDCVIAGLNDSKKLSSSRREVLSEEIRQKASAWSVAEVAAADVDAIGILPATFKAMMHAIRNLQLELDLVLVDGNLAIPGLPFPQQTIIGGDAKALPIAAASILAKVWRDNLMKEYDEQYPLYSFGRHKGYGTKDHRAKIMSHGFCPLHRRTFLKKWLPKGEGETWTIPFDCR